MQNYASRLGITALMLFLYIYPAQCEERIVLTLYITLEQNVCPGGYHKCSRFTASKFDHLLKFGKLRQIDSFSNVVTEQRSATVSVSILELNSFGVSLARNCSSSVNGAALLVGELHTCGAVQSTPISVKAMNRRAFDYASLCGLDPEEGHDWKLSWHGETLHVTFR